MLKNPHWREADQFLVHKHDRGVKLQSTGFQVWALTASAASTKKAISIY